MLELARNAFDGLDGVIFHGADADFRFEDHDDEAVFINVDDEKAAMVALLINAVEFFFVDQTGDGLIGHERAGSKRSNGGEIEVVRLALLSDEEAALVNDQRGHRVRGLDEFAKDSVQFLNVFLDKLGQGSHVMRIAEHFG